MLDFQLEQKHGRFGFFRAELVSRVSGENNRFLGIGPQHYLPVAGKPLRRG